MNGKHDQVCSSLHLPVQPHLSPRPPANSPVSPAVLVMPGTYRALPAFVHVAPPSAWDIFSYFTLCYNPINPSHSTRTPRPLEESALARTRKLPTCRAVLAFKTGRQRRTLQVHIQVSPHPGCMALLRPVWDLGFYPTHEPSGLLFGSS